MFFELAASSAAFLFADPYPESPRLWRIALQNRCILCHAKAADDEDLCLPCLAELPWNSRCCHLCAVPMAEDASRLCRACFAQHPLYDRCFSPLQYAKPIDHLIGLYKHGGDEITGAMLSRLMLHTLGEEFLTRCLDATVMAVPMHRVDLRQRGFNQAQQLALDIASALHLPIDHNLVAVARHKAQKKLTAHQRQQNLRGVFDYPGHSPPHILIIDDVVTTGATVSEVARTLKQRGSEQISVLCLARTPAPGYHG